MLIYYGLVLWALKLAVYPLQAEDERGGSVAECAPVPAHGGRLLPLLQEDGRAEALKEACGLKQVRLSSKEASDVVMLGMGAFSPLQGFLTHEDYRSVLGDMRLADGFLWPIPITLSAWKKEAQNVREGEHLALVSQDDSSLLGVLKLEEKFEYDKQEEAREVFGTEDDAHPGVAKTYAQGDMYLGGPVKVLSEGGYPERFPEYARPEETRRIFTRRGWSTVAAFQTRNPMHRAHEYCTKVALELCDGLFVHPLVGQLKKGDIPAEVRLQCYRELLDNYYPGERVVLKAYPMEMRYAGPREALLHAIVRQNFGCSHLIVGRDHAGVGNYYAPFRAQEVFDQIGADDLHIKSLKMDWCFWCYRCEAMTSAKTCPHSVEDRLVISGTELRQMLTEGRTPPPEFSRPEVMQILLDYYRNQAREKQGR